MKKKLTLKQIKVDSFVTSIEDKNLENVKGGSSIVCLTSLITISMMAGCEPGDNGGGGGGVQMAGVKR